MGVAGGGGGRNRTVAPGGLDSIVSSALGSSGPSLGVGVGAATLRSIQFILPIQLHTLSYLRAAPDPDCDSKLRAATAPRALTSPRSFAERPCTRGPMAIARASLTVRPRS